MAKRPAPTGVTQIDPAEGFRRVGKGPLAPAKVTLAAEPRLTDMPAPRHVKH